MTLLSEPHLDKLQFYVTTPYQCGYLPNKRAQSLIATPHHLVDTNIYSGLIQQGFRRSGKFVYRPHCEHCNACIPTRVVLADFTPNRSQKRAFKQHADLSARILPLGYHQAHFELYANYQTARHAEPELCEKDDAVESEVSAEKNTNAEIEQYRQFLCQSNVESLMIEFRDAENQLKIVSVVDLTSDGVSAVYTFYDTTETKASDGDHLKRASYGTYSIMWQTEWTKSLNLPYLYLGYWIQDSEKMAYKQAFKPQQKLIDGEWI